MLSLGVPASSLAQWLVFGGVDAWGDPALASALLQTLAYAGLGAAATTIAAVPMAWLGVRFSSRTVRALEALHYVSSALPGIVIALALVSITVRIALPLYQTVFTVMIAYMLMFLPRALVGLRASIAQVPKSWRMPPHRSGARRAGSLVDHDTDRGTGCRCGRGAGLRRRDQRAHRHASAGAERDQDSRHRLLGAIERNRLRRGGALRAPQVLLSLPMTWILYRQSQKSSGR